MLFFGLSVRVVVGGQTINSRRQSNEGARDIRRFDSGALQNQSGPTWIMSIRFMIVVGTVLGIIVAGIYALASK